MGRKAGRKPKYRSEDHGGGIAQDFGPQEIWSKSVVVRGLGAEVQRHHVINQYVLRNRVVAEGGVVAGAGTYNEIQCPLDYLMKTGLLGEGEQMVIRFDAGEALAELFRNASIEGKTTATWNSAGGGGKREQEDWAAEDEMRYHRALKAIRPFDALVMNVCVHDMMPPLRRKSIDVLVTGLDLLAKHLENPRHRSSRHEKRVG